MMGSTINIKTMNVPTKKITVTLIIILLVAGSVWIYSSSHKKTAPIYSNPDTKGDVNRKTETASSSDHNASTTRPNSDNSLPLISPTGTFISNHHPNLSGNPAPNKMASTCLTSPGVYCSIAFSRDGVTKSLPEQITNSGGATSWSWRLQDIGLTEGSWQVKATVRSGTKTQTAFDAMNLEVAN